MSGPAPPAEERSYLVFMAAALALTLVAGLALGALVPLAPALGLRLDTAALVQAHAEAQLAGWLGLFTSGMALRLVPRLAHRRPLPGAVPAGVLALLAAGVVVRLSGRLVGAGALVGAGSVAAAAGMVAVGAVLAWTLARSTGERHTWRLPAWAAAGWWIVWGLLTLASADGRAGLETAWQWVGLLGAIGNLIWAVQARSVPVFYGRRPHRLRLPVALYNGGAALALGGALSVDAVAGRIGLALAGVGLVWLAIAAGAVRGRPRRLRLPSRAPARFIATAGVWAMAAGACLVLAAAAPALADRLDDAALHLLGLGLATTLIVGMARLLAPVFAIARAAPAGRDRALAAVWAGMALATAARAAAALGHGAIPAAAYDGLIEIAGVAAWTALALFAAGFVRAWLLQGPRRRALVRSARPEPSTHRGARTP